MLKNVKCLLSEASRLTDIYQILDEILSANHGSYPVAAFNKDGKCCFRVSEKEVKAEALLLEKCISADDFSKVTTDMFDNLYQYICSTAEIHLHNYAVDAMHRLEPNEELIEKARIWSILRDMIYCIDIEDDYVWFIPDGWKGV